MQKNYQNTIALTFPAATYQTKDIAWTLAFTLAAVIFPALFAHTPHNQWITGTIVNAILFLAVWRVGIANTLLVAILPSAVALMRGLLPAPMAMLIPFIIFSNIILISAFYALKKHLLVGIVSASLAKFIFLFAITSYFIKVTSPQLVMMQWPQLFTALAGGLIALSLIKLKSLS
jgi:hypothetical protein